MFRLFFYNIIALVIGCLLPLSSSYGNDQNAYNIGRLPGAKILQGSCLLVPTGGIPSCDGITRDTFKVTIRFAPNNDGAQVASKSITYPGPSSMPKSYTVTNLPNSDKDIYSFYFSSNCGGASGCNLLTNAYKNDGSYVATTAPGAFVMPTSVDNPITFSGGEFAKTIPSKQTVVTSGHVKTTAQKCSAGSCTSITTTKRFVGSSNLNNDPGDPIDPDSCTGNLCEDIRDDEGKLVTGLAITNIFYAASTSNSVVDSDNYLKNTIAATGYDTSSGYPAGSVKCKVGTAQSYVSGQPIMTKDCEIQKDLGRCYFDTEQDKDPTKCSYPLISGGDLYQNKQLVLVDGEEIMSVEGVGKTVQYGSLYDLMFSDNSNAFSYEISQFKDKDIDVLGDGSITAPFLKTTFQLRYQSDKACVYAYDLKQNEWRITTEYPKSKDEANAKQPESDYTNCVPAPPPTYTDSRPPFNILISPVCTNYDNSSTAFRWPNGTNRAFLGIVVECIEDTLMNIFNPAPGSVAQNTFFHSMQSKIQASVRGLMALYIIFFGYKLMIGKSVPKRAEWMWTFLKLSLVVYFALGTGMIQLLPEMLKTSKRLSVVLVEAALSDPSAAMGSTDSYQYCDFRDTTKFAYPTGKEYMQLWDMIDCKLSKYLGVGDNSIYPDAPQMLFVAVTSLVSLGFGVPIFIFIMVFLALVIMLTMRIVYTYIMAVAALVMLVFISPLVIPTVFFEITKPIFSQWTAQLMAFWLQPIILFGFLSFMFIVIDGVMFGGNHHFEDSAHNSPSMKLINGTENAIGSDNKSCGGTDTKCTDKSAAGYQLQIANFTQEKFPTNEFFLFKIWRLSLPDEGMVLMIALGKLVLIVFIAYCLLASVENISARLVGAMGTGAASYASAAPVVSPKNLIAGGASAIEAFDKINPLKESNRTKARKGLVDFFSGGSKADSKQDKAAAVDNTGKANDTDKGLLASQELMKGGENSSVPPPKPPKPEGLFKNADAAAPSAPPESAAPSAPLKPERPDHLFKNTNTPGDSTPSAPPEPASSPPPKPPKPPREPIT